MEGASARQHENLEKCKHCAQVKGRNINFLCGSGEGCQFFGSIFRHPVAWLGGQAASVTPMHQRHFSKLVRSISGNLFYTGKRSVGPNLPRNTILLTSAFLSVLFLLLTRHNLK